jgi:hypothetical protein
MTFGGWAGSCTATWRSTRSAEDEASDASGSPDAEQKETAFSNGSARHVDLLRYKPDPGPEARIEPASSEPGGEETIGDGVLVDVVRRVHSEASALATDREMSTGAPRTIEAWRLPTSNARRPSMRRPPISLASQSEP